ncbi:MULTISPECIES: winged helix-turn-helix transcriptional regulator [Tsukamurella]|uniref:Helix-turn-helix transcriptional regulator n=2 Tax=Tsukamurella TaxID=2060 RepID=A0A5C5RZF3_9ACTN|nr:MULTISPECIES: helix-turn-helix domain-containing protein [Tsukamurella]NMD54290.1 helix-turn-helix transcriptional regulator [Tsukamurella columbiensis]TWS28194.1 helix-turn-helix transcriptional regulator [Tsukamurella conjunctivitidis]
MPDRTAEKHHPRDCTIADALEVVGDRWSLLIVRELFYTQRRFTEIARNTGAPRDVLTVRLRKLVERGVIAREQYSERPPRYEYRLTEVGRALSPVLLTLKRWGHEHVRGGGDPVRIEHVCGEEFRAEVHCAACGDRVGRGELVMEDALARPLD